MRAALTFLFGGIFVCMAALTLRASLAQGIWPALQALWPDPWFQATLADTYFSFLAIWLWVAWRERTWTPRWMWLALFLGLGNLAISAYVLLQLRRIPPGGDVVGELFRRPGQAAGPLGT